MYVWMAVTPDEYELPIAVADSALELAQMMGTTETAIFCRRFTAKSIKRLDRVQYLVHKVWIGDIDDDD